VSGIWLLRGMRPDGVLTTVDIEVDHQRLARLAFSQAGFAANRARFIPGRALDVLPRLADGGYDMVFCDGDEREYAAYLAEALRLLRPGGMVVFGNVPGQDRTELAPAPGAAPADAVNLAMAVREDDRLVPALLPVGGGLLCAVKAGAAHRTRTIQGHRP
jgi:predicted O-methyltransferase YrrM